MIGGRTKPRLRKRVVTIFVIAVLFPCLYLGYLGLNSIKQEKQWQQQLVRENLQSSLSLMEDRIESAFDDQMRLIFRQISFPKQLTASYITSLRNLKIKSSLVQEIFLLDNELGLLFPKAYLNGKRSEIKNIDASLVRENEHLQIGEHLEALGKLDEALNEYELEFSSKLSKSIYIALLSRKARVLFKKGDYEKARIIYQTIIDEDENQFYGEEIPYVLIAHLQLLEMAETKKLTLDVNNQILKFYRMLVENSEKLDLAQYNFSLLKIKTLLLHRQQFFSQSQRGMLNSLTGFEKDNEDEQIFRNLLHNNILSELGYEITSKWNDGSPINGLNGRNNILYKCGRTDKETWEIGICVNEELKSTIRFIGVRIRKDAFTDFALSMLKESQLNEEFQFALVDTANKTFLPARLSSPTILLSKSFSRFENFASENKLALVFSGGNPLEAISSKGLIIYYILLGAVIVLIAFGIIFILRDISREEKISLMKSEFIANVSHEIKTPIATIRTLAENLNEGWVEEKEKQKEYFYLIEREAERLTHLVENILDFSRLEKAKKAYRMETTSVGNATKKAIERFHLLVDGQGVVIKENIENELPPYMLDSEAYEQVLLNLMDNAVKYSQEDKVIEVSAKQQNDSIVIEVSDHGIGISKKDIEKIFDKFTRIPMPDGRKIPGSGIGLTLVKEIVEAHGGTIEVESEIDRGSTFKLFLPLSNDNEERSVAKSRNRS